MDDDISDLLPTMQSDIMLSRKVDGVERVLVMDAKYYGRTTQVQFDTHTVHSGNLYQIFTYVKTKENELADVIDPCRAYSIPVFRSDDDMTIGAVVKKSPPKYKFEDTPDYQLIKELDYRKCYPSLT